MSVSTVAGTTISIVADTPATFDAVGYEVLEFAKIGEVTDGGSHGRVYAEVAHNPIDTRGTQKFKGSFNEGNKTLQLGVDRDDEGQIVAKEALNSDADYSFKVEYPTGDIDYFQAKVMSFVTAASSVDSVIAGTIELSITTNKAGVGIIEASA